MNSFLINYHHHLLIQHMHGIILHEQVNYLIVNVMLLNLLLNIIKLIGKLTFGGCGIRGGGFGLSEGNVTFHCKTG